MWGWIGIIIGLFGGLISLTPIQGFIKKYCPRINDSYINRIRILLIIVIALVGILGLVDRAKNENKLKQEIKNINTEKEKMRWRRAAKFGPNGSLTPGVCLGGDYLCQMLRPTLIEDDKKISADCKESNYAIWQKAIKHEPDFPFPYCYMAFCYKKDNNPDWINYAQKAKDILSETTKFDEPYTNQKAYLQIINQLMENK